MMVSTPLAAASKAPSPPPPLVVLPCSAEVAALSRGPRTPIGLVFSLDGCDIAFDMQPLQATLVCERPGSLRVSGMYEPLKKFVHEHLDDCGLNVAAVGCNVVVHALRTRSQGYTHAGRLAVRHDFEKLVRQLSGVATATSLLAQVTAQQKQEVDEQVARLTAQLEREQKNGAELCRQLEHQNYMTAQLKAQLDQEHNLMTKLKARHAKQLELQQAQQLEQQQALQAQWTAQQVEAMRVEAYRAAAMRDAAQWTAQQLEAQLTVQQVEVQPQQPPTWTEEEAEKAAEAAESEVDAGSHRARVAIYATTKRYAAKYKALRELRADLVGRAKSDVEELERVKKDLRVREGRVQRAEERLAARERALEAQQVELHEKAGKLREREGEVWERERALGDLPLALRPSSLIGGKARRGGGRKGELSSGRALWQEERNVAEHDRLRDWVHVRKSAIAGAGMGLFASYNFAKGQLITRVNGKVMPLKEAEALDFCRYQVQAGAYAVRWEQALRDRFVDEEELEGRGMLVNSADFSDTVGNSSYLLVKPANKAAANGRDLGTDAVFYITATRAIKAGEELLVSTYTKQYWMLSDRLDREEAVEAAAAAEENKKAKRTRRK